MFGEPSRLQRFGVSAITYNVGEAVKGVGLRV